MKRYKTKFVDFEKTLNTKFGYKFVIKRFGVNTVFYAKYDFAKNITLNLNTFEIVRIYYSAQYRDKAKYTNESLKRRNKILGISNERI